MDAAISTHFASIEPVAPDVFLDRLLHPARHFKHPTTFWPTLPWTFRRSAPSFRHGRRMPAR